jgi:hypothetical protein
VEIAPHFDWLASGKPMNENGSARCFCKYCNGSGVAKIDRPSARGSRHPKKKWVEVVLDIQNVALSGN